MRSTRAAAAIARLNTRSPGHHYGMVVTSNGLFQLTERGEHGAVQCSEALALDEFVVAVNAMGPQPVRRMTRADVAFERQLVKKPKP